MIVPMKKVSLITLKAKKEETLKKLRKLGIMHIEISEGSSEKLNQLKEQISLLESALYSVGKTKVEQKEITNKKALEISVDIKNLTEEKSDCLTQRASVNSELERLKSWGDIDILSIKALQEKGIDIAVFEMPNKEYAELPNTIKTVKLDANKSTVKFLLWQSEEELDAKFKSYQ